MVLVLVVCYRQDANLEGLPKHPEKLGPYLKIYSTIPACFEKESTKKG